MPNVIAFSYWLLMKYVYLAVTAAVTMPGGRGAPPGTPSAKPKVNTPLSYIIASDFPWNTLQYFKSFSFIFQLTEKRNKTVVALYPFKAIESGDLSLEKVFQTNYNKIYKLIN